MDLKDIIKAEIERTMREKLNETVEVEFSIGQDKIVAKTAISYSLNDIEYTTDSSNEAIKDIVKELNVNYEEPINFMFFKHKNDYLLLVDDNMYFGFNFQSLKVTVFHVENVDPVFPATKKVLGKDLKSNDWVMFSNDIYGFGIVMHRNIVQYKTKFLYHHIKDDDYYTKLIF